MVSISTKKEVTNSIDIQISIQALLVVVIEIKPVQFQLSRSDGQHALSQCYLYEQPAGSWVHYHGGGGEAC